MKPQKARKANKIVGLIKKTVGLKNRKCFLLLFKSLVRPILEYVVPVWSPYLKKDIKELEKVQRRATKCALGMRIELSCYVGLP